MTQTLHEAISVCRICNQGKIEIILDLGEHPPANSLREDLDECVPAIPLTLVRCSNCGTVQLSETVAPEYLFRDYVWVTGTSATAHDYSDLFCEEMFKRCGKDPQFVMEVASNDGTFLKRFKDKGCRVLGVDPAQNIAKIANKKGIFTLPEFFGLSVAESIVGERGQADCIYARNVVPHVDNVHDVISGIARCLKAGGTGAIEFHYARVILEELHYDSIYHEHLYYFSLRSIFFLLQKHGLKAFDLMESPISGGSVVLYFSAKEKTSGESLRRKLEEEDDSGMNAREAWQKFAESCRKHRKELIRLVSEEVDTGSRMVGYGASARSSTLLNYCGINQTHLSCIADQNPLKHNKLTAGTHIPILSPDEVFAENPDVILLLAWNFKEEILSILKDKYSFSGKLLLPLPGTPKVVHI